jgi:hypothetical protein
MDFITRDAPIAAMNAWVLEKGVRPEGVRDLHAAADQKKSSQHGSEE